MVSVRYAIQLSEYQSRIKKSFFIQNILLLVKVTYIFYMFSKFLMTSQGSHDNHCLFSMFLLLLLLRAIQHTPFQSYGGREGEPRKGPALIELTDIYTTSYHSKIYKYIYISILPWLLFISIIMLYIRKLNTFIILLLLILQTLLYILQCTNC